VRFSLFGSSLDSAVDSVRHVFDDDMSPFFELAAFSPGLQIQAKFLTVESYMEILDDRFRLAGQLYQQLFMGKRNDQAPDERVFPILADLINCLGLNFGIR
jgi:hypothetical protein